MQRQKEQKAVISGRVAWDLEEWIRKEAAERKWTRSQMISEMLEFAREKLSEAWDERRAR